MFLLVVVNQKEFSLQRPLSDSFVVDAVVAMLFLLGSCKSERVQSFQRPLSDSFVVVTMLSLLGSCKSKRVLSCKSERVLSFSDAPI